MLDVAAMGVECVAGTLGSFMFMNQNSRYCHQSGGTDVVDLPDILLPAGQYLDMFDSESETDNSGASSDANLVEV